MRGERRGNLALELLARRHRHRLAGGDIRNAALEAIFLAEGEGAPLAQAPSSAPATARS